MTCDQTKMPKYTALLLLTLMGSTPTLSHAQLPASPRQRVLMDADWRFHLAAPAALQNAVSITDWRWKADDGGKFDAISFAAPGLDTSGPAWASARTGDDIFHGRVGSAWYRTMLPDLAGSHRVLQFEGVDDNATVYLNGKKLLYHAGWNDPL